MNKIVAMMIAGAMMFSTTNAQAVLYEFGNITNNSGIAGSYVGEFTLEVEQSLLPGLVNFTFKNLGPNDGVISAIHFDDSNNLFFSINNILPSLGVDFTLDNSINLPGGNTIGFDTTLGVKALPPPTGNGINAGESLTLSLLLNLGVSFNDVIGAIENYGQEDGLALGIGIHVISLDIYSESYVVPHCVPEPSTYLLLGSSLGLVAMAKRKKVAAQNVV